MRNWIKFYNFMRECSEITRNLRKRKEKIAEFDQIVKSLENCFKFDNDQKKHLFHVLCVSEIEEHLKLTMILHDLIGLSQAPKSADLFLDQLAQDIDSLNEILEIADLSEYFAKMGGFLFLFDVVLGRVGPRARVAPRHAEDARIRTVKKGVLEMIINFAQNNKKILGYFGVEDWNGLIRFAGGLVASGRAGNEELMIASLTLFSVLSNADRVKRLEFLEKYDDRGRGDIGPGESNTTLETVSNNIEKWKKQIKKNSSTRLKLNEYKCYSLDYRNVKKQEQSGKNKEGIFLLFRIFADLQKSDYSIKRVEIVIEILNKFSSEVLQVKNACSKIYLDLVKLSFSSIERGIQYYRKLDLLGKSRCFRINFFLLFQKILVDWKECEITRRFGGLLARISRIDGLTEQEIRICKSIQSEQDYFGGYPKLADKSDYF